MSGSVGGSVGGGGNGSTPGSNGGPITISHSAGSTSDVLNSVLSNLKIISKFLDPCKISNFKFQKEADLRLNFYSKADAMVAAHASTQQYSYNNLGASIGGGISGGGSITVVGDGRGGRMNGGGNGVNGAGPGNGGQPLNNVGVTATSAPNPDDHYSVCQGEKQFYYCIFLQ